tara:strand:- start:547 stop:852 length:306 start_codon:yes stop_codon:yes gene_type:complete
MKKYKTLRDFYPYYLEEHKNKTTKLLHFIGTGFSIIFLAQFFMTLNPINILFAILSGYGFAWISHFFVEHNKPATWTYPVFSLMSDYIMFWEILRGKHKIF